MGKERRVRFYNLEPSRATGYPSSSVPQGGDGHDCNLSEKFIHSTSHLQSITRERIIVAKSSLFGLSLISLSHLSQGNT